jgi:hypothetical protein
MLALKITLGYLILLSLALMFNAGASIASGNATDPHRDDGQ